MTGRLMLQTLALQPDTLAPDGSEIRLLPLLQGGSMVHCRVPAGATTRAVRHRTVEELWFVTAGSGEIWRKTASEERIDRLAAGVALTIPLEAEFQFRNGGKDPLDIVIVTMPPWPGMEEAELVDDHWIEQDAGGPSDP